MGSVSNRGLAVITYSHHVDCKVIHGDFHHVGHKGFEESTIDGFGVELRANVLQLVLC